MCQKKNFFSEPKELDAIPYDIPGAEYSHEDYCTFDYIVKKHNITDSAVQQMVEIVRDADTDHFDLAAQSGGLWVISAGLSFNYKNDYEMLETGIKIYDALYSWAKYAQDEKHTWKPGL